MIEPRVFYRGSSEYISAIVTANVVLDAQTVEISIDDRNTWLPATWDGAAGMKRTCRTSNAVTNADLPNKAKTPVFVRVIDGTETPYLFAGDLFIK